MAEEDKPEEQVGEANGEKLRTCLGVLGTDKLLYSLGCCRAIVVLIVGTLGFMIAMKTSGLKYYAKLEQNTDSLMPYCRAIVFPEFSNGTKMKIDMGTYGGGTALDLEKEFNYGLEVKAVKGASSRFGAKLKGKVLEDENCHFIAVEDPDHKTKENQSKVLLVNKITGRQIKMPLFCGGEKPGLWIESPDGGMWSWSLLVSMSIWVVLRFFQVMAEAYITYMRHKKCLSGSNFVWLIVVPCFSVFFTLAMNFFIAPLEHMENKSCPQLVTTWYSGKFQAIFGAVVLAIAFGFFSLATMFRVLPKEIGEGVHKMCPCCFCLPRVRQAISGAKAMVRKRRRAKSQGEQGDGEEKKDQQADGEENMDIEDDEQDIDVEHQDSKPSIGNQTNQTNDLAQNAIEADDLGVSEGGTASWLIGFTVCVTLPAAVGGAVYSYKYFLFYFFIGIHFDLKISWPEFDLSTQFYLFRVMSSIGVSLDIVKNAANIVDFCFRKIQNLTPSDEVPRQTPGQSSDRTCA